MDHTYAAALFQDFVDLGLRGPPMQVVYGIWVDDVYGVDGPMVRIPVAVVSYATGQKYIIPFEEGTFVVPVPVGADWAIHVLTTAQLVGIVRTLRARMGGDLEDFYRLVSGLGTFWRMYL